MMRLFAVTCLVVGVSLLWSWVDDGPRWMLAVAITLLLVFAVIAPHREREAKRRREVRDA